jgi:hypothetical protein
MRSLTSTIESPLRSARPEPPHSEIMLPMSSTSRPPKLATVKPAPTKRTYKQEWVYHGMEMAILKAEVERLEAESSDPVMTTDHVRAAETFQALSRANELVRRLYARWAELEE